jgi:rhamnogalacturonan endolyase
VGSIQGQIVAIADCLGDWREEIVTSLKGEIRIYTTTVPASTRRVCLMQDRMYRSDVAMQTMGYFYPPQLGKR